MRDPNSATMAFDGSATKWTGALLLGAAILIAHPNAAFALPPEGGPGAVLVEPDPQALALLDDGDAQERRILARSVTAYRRLVEEGSLPGDALRIQINSLLDALPVATPGMQSAVEAARTLMFLQADTLLQPLQAEPPTDDTVAGSTKP